MKENFTFEEAIKRLDEIVRLLSTGEANLEKSLELYGESAKLMAFCNKTLEEAKLSVEEILPQKSTEVENEGL